MSFRLLLGLSSCFFHHFSAQPVSTATEQVIRTQGDNYGGQPGVNPILVRASNVNTLPVATGGAPSSSSTDELGSQSARLQSITPAKPARSAAAAAATSIPSGHKMNVLQSTQLKSSSQTGSAPRQRADGSGRVVGAHGTSKTPQEPQPPEVQAQIVSRLSAMAERYLPAVLHAMQLVAAQPEAHLYVRKYTKLKDILENPDANLHVIRLGQVNLIEQLLNEIERNPMHLVQQQQSQQQQHMKSASAAQLTPSPSPAAGTPSSVRATLTDNRKQTTPTNVEDQLRQRNLQHQGQTSASGQSRFRAPSTNLNILLTQSTDGSSPSGVPSDGHAQSTDVYKSAHLSPSGGGRIPAAAAAATSTVPMSPGTTSGVASNSGYVTQNPSSVGSSAASDLMASRQQSFPTSVTDSPLTRLANPLLAAPANPNRTFYANLQAIISDFQKMTDRAGHDSAYRRRLVTAVNELSHDTKQLRESLGVLLPQDVQNSCLSATNVLTQENPRTDEQPDVPPLVRPSSRKRDRSPAVTLIPDEMGLETGIDGDLEPSENQVQQKKFCADLDPEPSVSTPPSVTHQKGGSPEANTLTLLRAIALGNDEPNPESISNSLFSVSVVPCDPDAAPMREFAADQIDRLNPRIHVELEQLKTLHIRAQANQKPPLIDQMETYATCADAVEWNTSCHLVLTLDKEEACSLPCTPPPLLIRLAPDYLLSNRINWHVVPKTSSSMDSSITDKSPFSQRERNEFLDLCYTEFDKKLNQQLRRATHYRISLYTIAKCWLDCLCAAMARFIKFDHNVFLFGS